MVVNPKPDKYNIILSHSVLTCKKCSVLWNRDENSARNIYKISYNAINKLESPGYLSRSKNSSDKKGDFVPPFLLPPKGRRLRWERNAFPLIRKLYKFAQPQFTCPEMGKPFI